MGKKSAEKTELVIVTGLSGAGKSRAVDALEDIGFFCVDNMPPKLIPTFVKLIFNSNEKRDRVAIVADIRLGDSFSDIFGVLDELKEDEINYKILFIDADNDVIMRRYQETRRKHPLADEFNTPSILEAIQKEREILLPARLQADYIVDTSNVTSSQFKERIAKLFLDNASISAVFPEPTGPATPIFTYDILFPPAMTYTIWNTVFRAGFHEYQIPVLTGTGHLRCKFGSLPEFLQIPDNIRSKAAVLHSD